MAATPNRAGALNVFVDTNLFVQCRALEDLAWVDILKAEEIRAEHQNALAIRLLMPRVVLRELERQKHGASPRRRDRARNAIGRMRKALRAGSRLLVIHESSPKVTLEFAPVTTTKVSVDALDDERLLAEAEAFSMNPGELPYVLTDDTGLYELAADRNLVALWIPEGWFLPVEPAESDRKIAELQARVERLETGANSPKLEVSGMVNGRPWTKEERLELPLIHSRNLSSWEVEELERLLEAAHPIFNNFDVLEPRTPDKAIAEALFVGMRWKRPSDQEIARYREEYSVWVNACESVLSTRGTALERSSRQMAVHFSLSNGGTGRVADPGLGPRGRFARFLPKGSLGPLALTTKKSLLEFSHFGFQYLHLGLGFLGPGHRAPMLTPMIMGLLTQGDHFGAQELVLRLERDMLLPQRPCVPLARLLGGHHAWRPA